MPQPRASHYEVIYLARVRWDEAAATVGHLPRVGVFVTRRQGTVYAMRRLLRHLDRWDSALAIEGEVLALVEGLLGRSRSGRGPNRTARAEALRNQRGLDRARDLICATVQTGLSLAEVAAEAGVAPSYVVDAFRARFGVPPHRMQTLLRLDVARRCLVNGASIADAAASAGFTDQSHLTRQFNRYLGTTPGRYQVEHPRSKLAGILARGSRP